MSENDKYKDPSNNLEILEKLKNLPTILDIKLYIDELYPEWCITFMENYSSDYPHLIKNWEHLCSQLKVKPTQIMIVDKISFDDSHSIISHIAECYTKLGFCVRTKNDYFPCSICNKAIPTYKIWKLFKDKNLPVPKEWSMNCTNC